MATISERLSPCWIPLKEYERRKVIKKADRPSPICGDCGERPKMEGYKQCHTCALKNAGIAPPTKPIHTTACAIWTQEPGHGYWEIQPGFEVVARTDIGKWHWIRCRHIMTGKYYEMTIDEEKE
jgi:hypothetical protein